MHVLSFPFLLFLPFLAYSTPTDCTNNSECDTSLSFYCINNTCTYHAPSFYPCTQHSDCASFPYLGNSSCTSTCNIESKCTKPYSLLSTLEPNPLCCTPVSLDSPCTLSPDICPQSTHCSPTTLTCRLSESSNYYVIGIILALIGSATINIGLNVEKYSLLQELRASTTTTRSTFKQPYFLCGFMLFVLGNACVFISLKFAAQSLIAPLGSIALVTNAIAAPLMNGESVGRRDIAGIALIGVGSVMVVVFSPQSEQDYTLCALLLLYKRIETIVYLCCMLMVICCLFVLTKSGSKRVKPLIYPTLGGMIGSLTVLFAKSSAELISLTIQGDNQFIYPFTYLMLVSIVLTSVGQVYFINEGLKYSDAMLQVPLFYVVYTLFTVVTGIVYFDEFGGIGVGDAVGFCGGVLIGFMGVGVLVGRMKEEKEELKMKRSIDEVEATIGRPNWIMRRAMSSGGNVKRLKRQVNAYV